VAGVVGETFREHARMLLGILEARHIELRVFYFFACVV
jgi:hypothetical protein